MKKKKNRSTKFFEAFNGWGTNAGPSISLCLCPCIPMEADARNSCPSLSILDLEVESEMVVSLCAPIYWTWKLMSEMVVSLCAPVYSRLPCGFADFRENEVSESAKKKLVHEKKSGPIYF